MLGVGWGPLSVVPPIRHRCTQLQGPLASEGDPFLGGVAGRCRVGKKLGRSPCRILASSTSIVAHLLQPRTSWSASIHARSQRKSSWNTSCGIRISRRRISWCCRVWPTTSRLIQRPVPTGTVTPTHPPKPSRRPPTAQMAMRYEENLSPMEMEMEMASPMVGKTKMRQNSTTLTMRMQANKAMSMLPSKP